MKMRKTGLQGVRAMVAAGVCLWAAASARAADLTATWTSASNGQWTSGANWSTAPTYPDNDALTYNATISMASRQVTLDGSVAAAVAVQAFTLTGIGAHTWASLNGVNGPTLTVNELFAWGSASLVGAGTLIAKGGIQFGYIQYASGNNNSWNIELEGTSNYEWDGVSRTSQNTGTITLRPGALFNLVSPRSITGGGTIVVQTDGIAGDAVFKRTGTDGTSVSIANQFNNAGLVQVQNGTLSLTGGGTSTGDFEVDSGKTLSFAGTHALTGTLGGAGTLAFDGTDITHDLTTATYAGTGPLRIVGQNTKVIIDADIEIASLTMIGNGGSDNVETQYSAKLDGAGDVRVSGLTTWTHGQPMGTGTLYADGGILFNPANNRRIHSDRPIVIGGDSAFVTVSDSRFWQINADVTNAAGTFQLGNSGRIIQGGGTFANAAGATFEKTATATSATTVSASFSNAGAIVVGGPATLNFSGGGTFGGTLAVGTGGTLGIGKNATVTATLSGAGTFAFDGTNATIDITGGTYAGTGPLRIVGDNTKVIIDNDITVASLTLIGNGGADNTERLHSAKLDGAGDVRVSGLTTWTHGQPMGTGTLYADGGIIFNPSMFRRIYSDRPIVIGGDSAFATVSDSRFWEISADVTNAAGTFRLGDSPRIIQGGGTFHNEPGAVFDKTTTVNSTSSITAPFSNTGTVRVVANGGTPTLTFSNVPQVSGGTLTGGTWQATNGTINLPGGNLLAVGADATVILEGTGAINTVNTALTTVDGGLFINGGKNFATGASGLALGNTGVIGGTGTLTGNIAGGGTVSPGASVGTFTLAGDLTPTNGFGFLLEAADAGGAPGTGWDLLLSSGTFDVTGIDPGGLLIDLAAGGGMGDEFSFTMKFAEFATITGTVTEGLFSVTDVNSRYIPGVHKFFVNEAGGALYLNMYIPEPSAFALLLVAGLALARQRPNVKRGA